MDCKEAIQKLDRYMEYELSEIEAFNVKKHLDSCFKCREEYDAMEEVFFTLSDHNVEMMSNNFTDKILDEVCVYEKNKNFKEVVIFKGLTSIIAGIIITVFFNLVQYKPLNIISSLYKGSVDINKIILDPIDRISEGMKEIAGMF